MTNGNSSKQLSTTSIERNLFCHTAKSGGWSTRHLHRRTAYRTACSSEVGKIDTRGECRLVNTRFRLSQCVIPKARQRIDSGMHRSRHTRGVSRRCCDVNNDVVEYHHVRTLLSGDHGRPQRRTPSNRHEVNLDEVCTVENDGQLCIELSALPTSLQTSSNDSALPSTSLIFAIVTLPSNDTKIQLKAPVKVCSSGEARRCSSQRVLSRDISLEFHVLRQGCSETAETARRAFREHACGVSKT